jgi:hypothetical protein
MPTKEQLERIQSIKWAAQRGRDGLAEAKLTPEDVVLLTERVEELDLEEYNSAEEIARFALKRLEEDLINKREWLAQCIEDGRIAELQVAEAVHALEAMRALLDKGMFASGDKINARWDAIEQEFLNTGALLLPAPEGQDEETAPEVVVEPESVKAEEPPPEPEPQVEAPERIVESPEVQVTETPEVALLTQAEQEDLIFTALVKIAEGRPQVQVGLKTLAADSGIPLGSVLPVLRRLEAIRKIDIVPYTGPGAKQPSTYRFTKAAMVAAVAVPPVRASNTSTSERILSLLREEPRTTTSLATMLDMKELVVCQSLASMASRGEVEAGEIPVEGRRAQRWYAVAA